MWVVKLGGSLFGSQDLIRWLETLVKYSDGKVIIVPGGGLFANAVREAQKISDTSDAVAHQLALLAMDQFGLLLAGMCTGLVTASSELEISERGWQHRCIVWLPSKMVLADERIPKNWQVTSDSLSAWLANKLNVEHLILVKSKVLIPYHKDESTSLQRLVDDEVIDTQFINYVADSRYQTWVLNKSDYTQFKQGFSTKTLKEKGLLINTAHMKGD